MRKCTRPSPLYRTASDEKLGVGLGTRLPPTHPHLHTTCYPPIQARASDHEAASPPLDDLDTPHFDDIPSPNTYLAQLRKRLERSQQTTRSGKPGASHLLSKPPVKPQPGRGTSDESSNSSGELSASETGTSQTVSEYEKRRSPRRYSPSTQQILLGGDGGTPVREGDVMASLYKINTQLGELLTKFNRPTPDYPGGLHSSRGLHSAGPLLDNELLSSTPLETSARQVALVGYHNIL